MKSLEIFSGAGGLAKGLEIAGADHSAFVEINKNACETLRENFEETKVFCGNIKDYDFSSVNNIDIVAGGPPCQPFSLGGKHKANQDSRDMFPYAINAIERLAPKAYVFENVKGLLRPSFIDYFNYIILRLTFPECKPNLNMSWKEHLGILNKLDYRSYNGIKYQVSYKLLNAADYGVPQCRERVVIVGIRSDLNLNWLFPTPTHSKEKLLCNMHITKEYWDYHKIPESQEEKVPHILNGHMLRLNTATENGMRELKPWVTIRDALSDLPDPRCAHEIPDHVFRDGARIYPGHTGSIYDWPAKTIKAGAHGVPGGENMIRFPDGSVRYFTVFEAKRIQTFPDDFYIHGSWGEAMRQIGNAVPVLLALTIGRELIHLLNKHISDSDVKAKSSSRVQSIICSERAMPKDENAITTLNTYVRKSTSQHLSKA